MMPDSGRAGVALGYTTGTIGRAVEENGGGHV